MSPRQSDRASGPVAPTAALTQHRWWALLGAVWMALAAGQAAMATIALKGGVEVFLGAGLLYGTTAGLWFLTTPPLVAFTRRLEWRGLRSAPVHSVRVIALHMIALGVVAALHSAWWRFAMVAFARQEVAAPFVRVFIGRFDLHLFTYLAIVVGVYVVDHWGRVAETRVHAARVEVKLVATRLHVLMMQLQPHFLFNTLHSISELVHRDGAVARRTLARLRDLLQFSVDQSRQAEVPLRDELRVLDTYVDIQRMRFGDRLSFDLAVASDATDAFVPCLVLQPLVENAIRHGTAPLGTRGRIHVSGARVGEWLELRVRDNGRGPGIRPREGEGLRNTRGRLMELYGDRQSLELRAVPGGGTEAVVRLPFHEAAALDDRSAPRVEQHSLENGPGRNRFTDAPRTHVAVMILAAWTFFGLLWTSQGMVSSAIAGLAPPPLGGMLLHNMANAWAWALLTGIIIIAVARWPARRNGWPARIALHATFALGVSALLLVGRWLVTDSTKPLITLAQTGWFSWDVMTYCVVAGYVQAAHLARLHRERAVRLASLEAELAGAELDVLKWHLQPAFLLETLDDIAAASLTDAERADDMTTSLGTLLRLMMQHVGRADSTVGAELEIVRAYLDVQRLRVGSGPALTVIASPDVLEARLPGALLLPLVDELTVPPMEGARAHSHLGLTIEARCTRDALLVGIRCRGGSAPASAHARGASGVGDADREATGVVRVRARLEASYGDRYRLVVDDSGSGERGITLALPSFAPGEAGIPPLQLVGASR